jgi:hypothetical protein
MRIPHLSPFLSRKLSAPSSTVATSYAKFWGLPWPPRPLPFAKMQHFHPKPRQVAIEPISTFILLERYGEKRDTAAWNAGMTEAPNGLPVEQAVHQRRCQGHHKLRPSETWRASQPRPFPRPACARRRFSPPPRTSGGER